LQSVATDPRCACAGDGSHCYPCRP
jgi:hypothetical protein